MDFAPPTMYPGQEEPPPAEAPPVDDGKPMTAAQKLAALKAKLADARKTNHKAVVEEDRRNKLGPQGLKDEAKQKRYDQLAKDGKKETDTQKLMATTAATAQAEQEKGEKKARRRGEYGWDVFNNEAQHRHYKKRIRRAEEEGRVGQVDRPVRQAPPPSRPLVTPARSRAARAWQEEDDGADPDPLAYGQAPPVAQAKLAALADDMNEAALRNAQFSRRRTFDEDKDVTYINRRNEVFNKKIERAFDSYTAEIRQNLERGTAL